MITRRLNNNDLQQIDELIDLRWNQILKRRNSQHNIILKNRIREYINLSIEIDTKENVEELRQVVGCFNNDGILISILTQKFWKLYPVYYIGNMVTRPKLSNLYNVDSIGLSECLDNVVKFAEERNYFKWYWITEVRGWNKREKEWFSSSSAFRRYHIFIDSMYHKGETGQFKYQNSMLGEYGANTTVAIKYAILKPKFLHNIFKQKGYLKDDFIPIQYSNLNEEEIIYKEIKDFKEIYEAAKNESNMLIEKEYYEQNFPDIAKGEYKHFGAYMNGKLIGTSSMIKYYDTEKKKTKIYHLWSWTHLDFRRKKIWLNLMKIKAKYIEQNNWCQDNTTNFVTVSNNDNRYKNIGWLEAYKINKIYKKNIMEKTIWYTLWENYKKI
jgi:hypothetical protein